MAKGKKLAPARQPAPSIKPAASTGSASARCCGSGRCVCCGYDGDQAGGQDSGTVAPVTNVQSRDKSPVNYSLPRGR